MIYIYDIFSNFSKELYSFYEWNKKDNIIHIRKIPLFKINSNLMLELFVDIVKIDYSLLSIIKNKTECFDKNGISTLEYACIFTDSKECLILVFDEKGKVKNKSRLLIKDELEIIEVSFSLKELILDYNVVKKEAKFKVLTRKEENIIDSIKKQIDVINKENNEQINAYVYYEWFLESGNNIDDLIKSIETTKDFKKKEEFLKNLKVLTSNL